MARGYFNAASFPATDLLSALDLLANLRAGIASLLKAKLVSTPIMCTLRASELPLSPAYETLANGIPVQGGRYRDTIAFFLTALDQRSPVYAELCPTLHEDVSNHAVDGLDVPADLNGTAPLVACALDAGVLLSIATAPPWHDDRVRFSALFQDEESIRQFECDNICGPETAGAVGERLEMAQRELVFENWDHLTGGATRSDQVLQWCDECRRRPGLEQLVMRSVALASRADYRPDGDLVKKLNDDGGLALFEVRAYFNGSNNVRLLFSRVAGTVIYGYAGLKAAQGWYDHAISQARSHIATLAKG